MSDEIASVSETRAEGETALLYADIRRTLGVPVTNLVWRHLATFDGALAAVWGSVKPLYATARLAAHAEALRTLPGLPQPARWPRSTLHEAGMTDADIETIGRVFENYDATNPPNLLALMAVLTKIEGTKTVAGTLPDPGPVPSRAPVGTLPPLLDAAAMPPEVVSLARRFNDIGLPGASHAVVAGVPRHLAHWPGFLRLCVDTLEPHAEALGAHVNALHADARRRAGVLASDLEELAPAGRTADVAAAVRHFASAGLITNYIAKVRMLMRTMPV